jgi:diaminopimelate epimerase
MSLLERRLSAGVSFEKWHGARNDFIFIAAEEISRCAIQPIEPRFIEELAIELCDRSGGIGADGLVIWHRDLTDTTTAAGIWNSDGSRAQTCGNALRCLSGVLLSKGVWDGQSRCDVVELSLGSSGWGRSEKVFAQLIHAQKGASPAAFVAAVAMGRVQEVRTGLPITSLPTAGRPQGLASLLSHMAALTFVQLANPHLVLLLNKGLFSTLSNDDFCQLGRYFQSENVCTALQIPLSNIGFLELADVENGEKRASAVVYERGAGLTPCCGSGGCAMRVAMQAVSAPRLKDEELFEVKMPGGLIAVLEQDKELVLSGPAECVARLTLAQL